MDTIKLTVREMRDLYIALSALSQRQLKFKAAYAIARTRKALEPEWEASEEVRQHLLKMQDEEERDRAWREHLRQEIEVRVHRFDADILPDEIEPAILEGILPMLSEDVGTSFAKDESEHQPTTTTG